MITVSAAFDSGNITVVSAEQANDIRLEIRKHAGDTFFQWFHFRVPGPVGTSLVLRIMNAGESSYPRGWEGYTAAVSEDRQSWRREPETAYANGVLEIRHTMRSTNAWFAYFAPYSLERHGDLIARCQTQPRGAVEVLGQSLDGRSIDMVVAGEPAAGKRNLWVIARQHPGESMAEWFMEGFLDRLLDPDDGSSRALLDRAVVRAVPNMNPDGSTRGYLRTNAVGSNLNREWAEPSMERSPEVFLVRQKMRETGLHLCLDAHGDEALPYNFIAGYEGMPDPGEALLAFLQTFRTTFEALNPDFQNEHGYPKAKPGKGNLTTSTGHLSNWFRAPAMTLEMPFKDTANAPMPSVGWSPERSQALGRSLVDVMLQTVGDIPERWDGAPEL